MFATKSAELVLAEELAKRFLDNESFDVHEVHLFGSVARGGTGNDIDLILSVDDPVFDSYINRLEDYGELSYGGAHARLETLKDFLDVELETGIFIFPFNGVDLFLFPLGWQERVDEVHERFDHSDPDFTWNVAQDARRFDQTKGEFLSPGN